MARVRSFLHLLVRAALFALIFMASLPQMVRKHLRGVQWGKVGAVLMTLLPLVLMGGAVAMAASPPSVNYVDPTGSAAGIASTVSTQIEQVAGILRWILGPTGLVALIVAAIMNHVPSQRMKEMAKEIAGGAVVGLLIAVFAPNIISFFMGL